MKRRFLSAIVTLLCVMACAFGLSACNNGGTTVAVESVTLNKTELTLDIGGEETLTATVTPDNATNKSVKWSSDNTTVAAVTNGKVTATAAGTATITATAGGKSATCTVTVNSAAPTTEVTAEQWTQIMESADNFTLNMQQGEYTSTIKIDGIKRMQIFGDDAQIVIKDANEYFSYTLSNGVWTKNSIDEDYYEQSSVYAVMTTYFKDDFALFAYADGKYTAATLDKSDTMLNAVLNDVEITIENGALANIKFVASSMLCEITDFGTTTVTLPTEYTESAA